MSARRASRGTRILVGAVTVVVIAAAMGPGAGTPVTQAAQLPCEHAGVPVALDGAHLALADVVAIGRDAACVSVPASAMQRVQQSFDVLLEAAREDKPIYGLTRGVGENKDKTVFPGGQITAEGRALSEKFNANLLRVQATATGPPARVEIVRAAMAIRLNAMLVGHTGVQGGVVQGLVDFLNRGITPVVPTQGTVGEADIDLLAHVGLALMGEGAVVYGGRTVPAATALRDAGLRPVLPFGKDALSTFSSNAYSAAIAVFSTQDARTVLARARQVFALSMEGLNGNVAPFLAEVQQVRAFPGQAAAATAVRDELRGSYLFSLSPVRALQDPLSYRTFSQVSGSAEDDLARLTDMLETQLNSADDNPTVLVGAVPPPDAAPQELAYYVDGNGVRGAVIPTANFEPLPWVLQLESLSAALAHVSSTSTERILRLGTPEFTHLSRFLTADPSMIGYAAIQKIPADLTARIRRLAEGASLDVIPVAGDIEDTSTNAAAAATDMGEIADDAFAILGVELMHAAQAVDLRLRADPTLALGRGTRPFLEAYRRAVPFLDADRNLSPDVARSVTFLRSGDGA